MLTSELNAVGRQGHMTYFPDKVNFIVTVSKGDENFRKDPLLTMILCGAKGDFRVI